MRDPFYRAYTVNRPNFAVGTNETALAPTFSPHVVSRLRYGRVAL
jgi:hypothetical protein